MITFTLCLLALIAGYFIYGRFIEPVSYTHLTLPTSN